MIIEIKAYLNQVLLMQSIELMSIGFYLNFLYLYSLYYLHIYLELCSLLLHL